MFFSAHLHMDEATPHLHVDFIPFITGSKRGLDTRVSLKQALAKQSFVGSARGDTEWNQWVRAEKERLSQIMERHGVAWEQLGTHDEHLSVMDYKKVQRAKEVAALDTKIAGKQSNLNMIVETERFIAQNAKQYDDNPQYQLPMPKPLMTAKHYHVHIAIPLVRKLKDVIRSILARYFERVNELNAALNQAKNQVWYLTNRIKQLEPENEQLRVVDKNFSRLKMFMGDEQVNDIIEEIKIQESMQKQISITRKPQRKRDLAR